jgi:hypothetical protein
MKPSHGARHAEARVGVEVVAAQATLDPLLRGVAVEHGPLAGAIHGDGESGPCCFERLAELRAIRSSASSHEMRCERAVGLTELRVLQPVGTVEHRRQVVALDAQEPLVDRAGLVAAHGHDLAVRDADLDAAARAAEAARRLVPLSTGRPVFPAQPRVRPPRRDPAHEYAPRSRRGDAVPSEQRTSASGPWLTSFLAASGHLRCISRLSVTARRP